MTTQEAAAMIGTRISILRTERQISQNELARRAGLFGPTVNRVERGERSPNLLTLCSIAVGLDVTTDDLTSDVCAQIKAERDAA